MPSLGELMVLITGNADGLKAALAEGSESTEAFGGEMDAAGASSAGFAAGAGEAEASTAGLSSGMDDAATSSTELGTGLESAGVGATAASGGLKDTESAANDAKAGMADASTEAGGLGSALSSAGTLGAAGIGLATVAVIGFALKAGSTVEDAYSQMAKATGLQGTQLQALEGTWNQVYANVPASASTVATVVDKVNNALGLQGQALTDATQNIIEYGIATKTDAASDTDAFTSGLIGANKGLAAMHEPLITTTQLSDMSTVAFQKTGKGIQDWGPAFDKATASMTAMGMSIPAQVAALSGFTQAGIPARQLTSILQGIAPAAQKAGESQTTFWNNLLKDAQTGNYSTDELKLLGKNVDNFTAAAKSGTITNQGFIDSLQNSAGATQKAGTANETFGESLTELKNKLTEAFAPLGTSILTILKNFITELTPVIDFIGLLAKGFAALPMPIQAGMLAIGLIAGGVAAAGLALKMFNIDIGNVIKSITSLKGAGLDDIATKLKGMVGLGGGSSGKAAGAASEMENAGASKKCPVDPACFDKLTQNAKGSTSEIENMSNEGSKFDGLIQDASGNVGELAGGTGDVAEGVEAAAGSGGIFSSIIGALPGPLAGILGGVGGIGEGIAGAGAAAGGGGLLGSVTGIAAAVPVVGWALLPVIGIFATLTATSGTFRSMLGGVLNTIESIVGWVGQLVGDLTSGNFSKFGDDLKSGLQGALDSLEHFDFGGWAAQMIVAIKESVGNIGSFILNGLSSLSNIADTITNFLNGIDWNSVIDGLVKAITGLFGGGGGGGGKSATTSVSTGMNKSLVDGATQAAPTVLTKLVGALGGLAVALALIFPKIAEALGLAILNYLVTLDWGSIANQLWTAIESALGQLGTWVWGLLQGIPGELWSGFTTALATLGTWIWGLLTPIPGELWTAVTTQNWGQIGQNILSGIQAIVGDVLNAFTSIDWGQIGSNFINAIISAIENGAGNLANAFSNTKISFTIPVINQTVSFNLAEGAAVAPRTGGVHVVVGEAGEEEYIIPKHKLGTDINSLPQLAEGAVVSGGSLAPLHTGGSVGSSSIDSSVHLHSGAIQINNPQIGNANDMDKLADVISRKLSRRTNDMNRRIGHARG
jgi:hypothetical protein